MIRTRHPSGSRMYKEWNCMWGIPLYGCTSLAASTAPEKSRFSAMFMCEVHDNGLFRPNHTDSWQRQIWIIGVSSLDSFLYERGKTAGQPRTGFLATNIPASPFYPSQQKNISSLNGTPSLMM